LYKIAHYDPEVKNVYRVGGDGGDIIKSVNIDEKTFDTPEDASVYLDELHKNKTIIIRDHYSIISC
jgi:hypothetical protein